MVEIGYVYSGVEVLKSRFQTYEAVGRKIKSLRVAVFLFSDQKHNPPLVLLSWNVLMLELLFLNFRISRNLDITSI